MSSFASFSASHYTVTFVLRIRTGNSWPLIQCLHLLHFLLHIIPLPLSFVFVLEILGLLFNVFICFIFCFTLYRYLCPSYSYWKFLASYSMSSFASFSASHYTVTFVLRIRTGNS